MGAAHQALDDAAWKPSTHEDRIRTGVMIGSGIGGLTGIAETAIVLKEKGPRRVSPFFIPGRLINLASGYVAIAHGLQGPNHAVVTACSTGAHAIGDAARLIALGDADVMVAGGTESPISRIGMAGFIACRALSTSFNDTPQRASRPYDRDRDGFVIGEGAGVVVLETYEHAKERGAKIYAELSPGRAYLLRRSTTSMRMGHRRRWATRSSLLLCSASSATQRLAYPCHPRNPPSVISWGRQGPSRRFSQFSRCAMEWCRPH
jgi:3-oxoacyl-[acyl-carrier-protein] synthase II